MTPDQVAVLVLVGAFVIGVRSTWHLRSIHSDTRGDGRRITGAFFTVAFVVTLAAGFYGFLSARRVLGFEPIPGIGIASVLVASAVLLIPLFLDLTVRSIRKVR